jgi:hypothetical protein
VWFFPALYHHYINNNQINCFFFREIAGEENMLGESSYKYLTVDEMKSLGDDSMPIDVTHDEKRETHSQQVCTTIRFPSGLAPRVHGGPKDF